MNKKDIPISRQVPPNSEGKELLWINWIIGNLLMDNSDIVWFLHTTSSINSIREKIALYNITQKKEDFEIFLNSLNEIFETFIPLLSKHEDLQLLLRHDNGWSFHYLHSLCWEEGRKFLLPRLNEQKDINNTLLCAHTFLAFLESLYYLYWISKEALESKKKEFSLLESLSIASFGIEVNCSIKTDVSLHWIQWDFIIFIMNIIKNAQKHGNAKNIELSLDGDTLIIKDDGKWIDEKILPHIFERGVSNWKSSGLWLRDLEKRGIQASASNEWLPNESWWKWACFTITLPI